jgi:hypothetical protein
MKFIALKELPQGAQPGDVFEATAEEGDVLILVGGAKKAEPEAEGPTTPSTRRRYLRRDLVAEA